MVSEDATGPLAGTTVLELGSLIAGPFAGQLLGDYGADVIKVEPLRDGDPMRRWGVLHEGDSLWWPTIGRNKRSVCIDIRKPAGQDLIRRLAAKVDVVTENFRPGRMAEWGLGYEQLSAANPALILAHVSGFGQSGPRSGDAGFGSIGEAMGGIRYTTGSPDRPPSRYGVSLGDALTSLFTVIGVLAALNEVRRSGRGQEVDIAIYEAVAALMESTMADYEIGGVVRERAGSVLPGVAPSNVYAAADGTEVVIAANADAVFARLCGVMARPELADDERYATHHARAARQAELDELIGEWTVTVDGDDLLERLNAGGVPAGRIFTAADMVSDPHYAARDMVLRLASHQGWTVPMTGIVPKFSATPGSVRATGAPLGAHTEQVLRDVADVSTEELEELKASGVIAVTQ
ncbi:MAG TPA: CaiB/BaiF CoA-transferase family protein [Mycobacteriales bacterium]|nr:CaiB/BaiF CoA-transferase family protein [Mycobacteriales bacterium]